MKAARVLCIVLALLLTVSFAWGQRTTLKVGIGNFFWEMDPATAYSNDSSQVHYNISETLVRLSLYDNPYKVIPNLALSWRQLSPTVWEYKLRPNVKFWDGTTMTADDVAWSLNRLINMENPAYSTAYGRVFYNFQGVKAIDPLTVQITTKMPEPLMNVMLAQTPAGIFSKAAFLKAAKPEDFFAMPVGAGPYKIDKVVQDQYIALSRFDGYWGEKAPLEKLIYYNVPEVASRITALINKEVDFIVSVPPDQTMALNKPGIKRLGVTWDMFHVYVLNAANPTMSNLKVRQAMNLAIDREALNEAFWNGKGVVPTALHYPGRAGYDPNFKIFGYDPEKAKQLVKESGYDGTPIELCFQRGYYLYADQVAPVLAEMWQEVGLNIKLQIVESYLSRKDPPKANPTRGWSNPMYFPDLMGGFDPHWSPSAWPVKDKLEPAIAAGGALNKRYTELYNIARYELDEKKRMTAYHELLTLINDEVAPWIILYQPYEEFAMANDITWKVPINYRPFTLTFRAGDITFKK